MLIDITDNVFNIFVRSSNDISFRSGQDLIVRSVNSAFEGKNLLRYFVFYMEFNSEKRNYVCLSVFKSKIKEWFRQFQMSIVYKILRCCCFFTFSLLIVTSLYFLSILHTFVYLDEIRNQKFFRAGEVLWN